MKYEHLRRQKARLSLDSDEHGTIVDAVAAGWQYARDWELRGNVMDPPSEELGGLLEKVHKPKQIAGGGLRVVLGNDQIPTVHSLLRSYSEGWPDSEWGGAPAIIRPDALALADELSVAWSTPPA